MNGSIPRLPTSIATYGTWPIRQSVIAGPSSVTGLGDEVVRLGAERVFLITTPSLVREARLLDHVRGLLGDRLVAEFAGCRAHTPRAVVLDAAACAREAGPDLFVTFGGGTVTDTGMAVRFVLSNGLETLDGFDAPQLARSTEFNPSDHPIIPQVAIPTTLAGADYSAGVGITDEIKHVKRVYAQYNLQPTSVFLDVDATRATPDLLWCSTGVKVMSDAIELLCSPTSHPFVQMLALSAVRLFYTHLPDSVSDNADVSTPARAYCQHAAWLSAYCLSNSTSRLGLGGGSRHQLGGIGVGHGDATCVMLPHILSYNLAVLDGIGAEIGAAIGLAVEPSESQDSLEHDVTDQLLRFITSLGLPTTLSAVGVESGDIPALAARIADDPSTSTNPRKVNASDIEALLRAAY